MQLKKGNQIKTIFARKVSGFSAVRGLMFTKSSYVPLYFSLRFPFSIHSFFVFYPFLAVWVNEKNSIIRTDIVFPFRFYVSPPVGTKGLFEIPIHANYTSLGVFLVGKQRFKTILSSRRTNI